MRLPKVTRIWAAAALAMGAALVVTSAASADSGVLFRGKATVAAVAPGGSTSNFVYNSTGGIDRIRITTAGEQVFAGGLTANCLPQGHQFCTDLTGASISSVHNSVVALTGVRVVPNPLAPELLDAAQGNITGALRGQISVVGNGQLSGTMTLAISGTGTYGCFTFDFSPVPLAVCQAGQGFLVPLLLDVTDNGTFTLGSGQLGSSSVVEARGLVTVNVQSNPLTGATGTVNIHGATAKVN